MGHWTPTGVEPKVNDDDDDDYIIPIRFKQCADDCIDLAPLFVRSCGLSLDVELGISCALLNVITPGEVLLLLLLVFLVVWTGNGERDSRG